MHYAQSYKTKQFFFVLIKLSIVSLAFYFIYLKLANNPNLNIELFLSKNTDFSLKSIALLLFLSLFNWISEILKWKTLVSSIQNISYKTALKQCLASLTSSLITPNRIGEYGAKAIYYTPNKRKQILLLNLISNVLQLSITFLLGAIGFLFFFSIYQININYKKLSFVVIASISLFVVLYLISIKIKGISFKKILQFTFNLPKKTLALSWLLSLIRYLIFSFQFYYLLLIFKIDITYLNAMMFITSMYLIASIIPAISVFDVLIKGSVAVFLFSFLGLNSITVLTIVSLMWCLNFALPSVIGSYYILRFKLPKNTP